MSTYVQLDRNDIEQWLTSNGWNWGRKSGTAGIYLLNLSRNVAIHFSSTVGSSSSARGHAAASANMKLVSLITGQALNKKAKGQSRFHRTTNWSKNWQAGLVRLKAAYEKSEGFYEAIAEIKDRRAYKTEMTARVEAFPKWSENDFLSSLHNRLTRDGVLTIRQKDALERMENRNKPSAPTAPSTPTVDPGAAADALLGDLRALWVAAPSEREFVTALAAKVKRGGGWSRDEGRRVDQLLKGYKREVEQAKRNDRRLRQASVAFIAAMVTR